MRKITKVALVVWLMTTAIFLGWFLGVKPHVDACINTKNDLINQMDAANNASDSATVHSLQHQLDLMPKCI